MTVSLVLIIVINLLDVRFYDRLRNQLRNHPNPCFIGLIFVSIVIIAGGGPNHETIGFRQ
ncbi:hypothetical protein BDW72DRAFT_164491 [Aspergillus terricola var. indicus]